MLEAVLRTASEMLAGKPLEQIDFQAVRGLDGVRSATVTIGDLELKVAQAQAWAMPADCWKDPAGGYQLNYAIDHGLPRR